MTDLETRRSERDARRDIRSHPLHPSKHEDDLLRYLGGVSYAEERAHREEGAHRDERAHRREPSPGPGAAERQPPP